MLILGIHLHYIFACISLGIRVQLELLSLETHLELDELRVRNLLVLVLDPQLLSGRLKDLNVGLDFREPGAEPVGSRLERAEGVHPGVQLLAS